MNDLKIEIIVDEKEIAQTISILVSNYITENYGELMKYLSRVRNSQEEINDSILTLMCLTFNKKEMKRLIEAYILTNDLTNDIEALKEELNK